MDGNTWFDGGEGPAPTELFGRYRLVGLAGTGPGGAVFRAHDTLRDETIAVKVVPRDRTGDAGDRAHLVREVRRARRLTHPNVMPTRDLVLMPTDVGADVLVTWEYVPGRSLAQHLCEHGALPVHEVLRIGRHVADALVAAHAEGVLHGNVDPEQVWLGDDDRVLLTGFGLGRALRSSAGTPGAAPDAQVDVRGLGFVLRAALAGPTDGPLPPERTEPVPAELVDLIGRCLAAAPTPLVSVRTALWALQVPACVPAGPGAARGLGGTRVVVLPFAATPELAHLAEAVSNEIAQTLAMTGGLRVCTRRGTEPVGAVPDGFDVAVQGELVSDGPDVVLTVRLVASPTRWRLWFGRFEVARTAVMPSAQRAATSIARALTSAAVPARHPGPRDPEALDLLLRGQHAARRSLGTTFDRSAALLELARARAPHDPQVLASVAVARLRRASSSGAPSDVVASAERLAREAVRRAPALPEVHLALVEILRYTGDAVVAAHAARRALTLAPGSAAALAAVGALWQDAGDLDASLFHLEQAYALDPGMVPVRTALARAWALLGRTEGIVGLLAGGPAIERHRLALWFPDRIPTDPAPPDEVSALLALLGRGRWVPETSWARLESTDPDRRVQADAAQRVIEARLFARFPREALERLDRAAAEDLVDGVWLDRCPLLDGVRGDRRFVAIVAGTQGRARAIRGALLR